MFRLLTLIFLGLVMTATGCETGSTHENMPDQGVKGQNVGQGTNKSGPVPGSTTGTNATASNAASTQAAPVNAPGPQ
jgi:hypothetical protein